MARKTIVLTIMALVASLFVGCDKAPSGVIPESDMVHVLVDFAKAEALIEQSPDKFPNDSSKLALKQTILKKYDADLKMYDSSLVWYAHNLKLYSQLHDKAVEMLEKEGNIKPDKNAPGNGRLIDLNTPNGSTTRRVYPSTGDSANLWKEPQHWLLTSAMRVGYITYDYKPDSESRPGDIYSLNLKAINASSNNIKIMMAVDYMDGTTSYINRTLTTHGWSSYDLQCDTSRVVRRVYGFLYYNIKPQKVAFIDSIYLLRTHLDPAKYHLFSVQSIAGPKEALKKDTTQHAKGMKPLQPSHVPGLPPREGPRGGIKRGDSTFKPKPGLNKDVIPSRDRIPNPNGAHTPRPPIK